MRSAQAARISRTRAAGSRGMAKRSCSHLAALRDRGQLLDRPEDRTAPDPLAPLAPVVVHEADHVVRVLVGAPEIPEKEIARRARAHDQRAHARGRARAGLGQEPVVREARREAERADEARRQEELHGQHRARRAGGLEEVEGGHEADGADRRRRHDPHGLVEAREPEGPAVQAEGEVQGKPDREEERQEAPEDLLVLERDLALEAQDMGRVEGRPDEERVQAQGEDEAAPAREPLGRGPAPGRLHARSGGSRHPPLDSEENQAEAERHPGPLRRLAAPPEDRRRRQGGRTQPDRRRDLCVAPAQGQLLVEVLAVRFVEALAAKGAADQRPRRVGQEQPQAHGNEDRSLRPQLRRSQERERRERVSQEVTADVPQENARPRPVERQETRRGPDEGRRQQGGERVPSRDQDARSDHDGLQGGQAVDPVEEVVEVHHRHDPEDRGGRGQRAQVVLQQRRHGHALEPPHSEHDQAHDAELSHEAREGGQAGTIVGQPDERQGDAAQQDRHRARVVGPDRPPEPESDEHRQCDRGPSAAWHHPLV